MIKFFAEKENITENEIYIRSKDEIKHLTRVLRLKPGDSVVIGDKEAYEYETEISHIGEAEVVFRILDKREIQSEPLTEVTLFQGIPKGPRLETVVQKSVETGVFRIVPVFMARTVVSEGGGFDKKLQRLRRIAAEAVKQCKRGRIPEVSEAMSFGKMTEELETAGYDMILVPYENAAGYTMKDALRGALPALVSGHSARIALIIGPEGGFGDEEIEALKRAGEERTFTVSLGKRILRTETAGPAALSMIMYELEL